MTTRQYKQYKGLKTESLHNNMTNLELVLNMLSETTTTEISQKEDSHGCRKPNRYSTRPSYNRGNIRYGSVQVCSRKQPRLTKLWFTHL